MPITTDLCHNRGVFVAGTCICDILATGNTCGTYLGELETCTTFRRHSLTHACTEPEDLSHRAPRVQTSPQSPSRIALVVNGFGALNPSSGIATAYASLAELLTTANYSVTVLYAVYPRPAGFDVAVASYASLGITLTRYVLYI